VRGGVVVLEGTEVQHLRFVGEVDGHHLRGGTLTLQESFDPEPGVVAPEGHRRRAERGLLADHRPLEGDLPRGRVMGLQPEVAEPGGVADHDLGHRDHQLGAPGRGDEPLQHGGLGVLADDDQCPGEGGHSVPFEAVLHDDRRLDEHAGRDGDDDPAP